MDLEQKLQEIFRHRTLQHEVLVFRNNMKAYGSNIKKTYKKDLQNLINADIMLSQTKIELPDPSEIPPLFGGNLEPVNFTEVLIEQTRTMEALKMLDIEP